MPKPPRPRTLRKLSSITRDGAAISTADENKRRSDATRDSKALRESVMAAIKSQARAWGITTAQAQTLLLDRRMPA